MSAHTEAAAGGEWPTNTDLLMMVVGTAGLLVFVLGCLQVAGLLPWIPFVQTLALDYGDKSFLLLFHDYGMLLVTGGSLAVGGFMWAAGRQGAGRRPGLFFIVMGLLWALAPAAFRFLMLVLDYSLPRGV